MSSEMIGFGLLNVVRARDCCLESCWLWNVFTGSSLNSALDLITFLTFEAPQDKTLQIDLGAETALYRVHTNIIYLNPCPFLTCDY